MITVYILTGIYLFVILTLIITYFVYPYLAGSLIKSNKKNKLRTSIGKIYVIIPAYNEESVIKEKILNTLQYLKNNKVVVISDGSDDQTDSICQGLAEKDERMDYYVNHERGGKNSCLNLAVEMINPEDDDILIFTDCNTFFDENSLSEIRNSLMNGASLVAGSMVYESMESDSAVSEGLYWKYEEWIRGNESQKGRLIVCNGGLFGMWGDCFDKLPAFVPNDFEGPLRLCGNGDYVMLNPDARGIETAINTPEEEYARKERMANRQMNCIIYLWNDLNKGTKLQVLFHKFFRWFGLHLFFFATMLLSFLILIGASTPLTVFFWLHAVVILVIIASWVNKYLQIDHKILPKVLHACKVHISGAWGAFRALKGRKTSIWEKATSNR